MLPGAGGRAGPMAVAETYGFGQLTWTSGLNPEGRIQRGTRRRPQPDLAPHGGLPPDGCPGGGAPSRPAAPALSPWRAGSVRSAGPSPPEFHAARARILLNRTIPATTRYKGILRPRRRAAPRSEVAPLTAVRPMPPISSFSGDAGSPGVVIRRALAARAPRLQMDPVAVRR